MMRVLERKNFKNILCIFTLILISAIWYEQCKFSSLLNLIEKDMCRPTVILKEPEKIVAEYSGYYKWVFDYSSRYDVDPELVLAIIKVESNGEPRSVSNKGAIGLMQLMPSTYTNLVLAHGLTVKNIYDSESNIKVGVFYISQLQKQYGKGNLEKILAAYNGGTRAAHNYPNTFLETRRYVKKVKEGYKWEKRRVG